MSSRARVDGIEAPRLSKLVSRGKYHRCSTPSVATGMTFHVYLVAGSQTKRKTTKLGALPVGNAASVSDGPKLSLCISKFDILTASETHC
jgi:hypothetical protein